MRLYPIFIALFFMGANFAIAQTDSLSFLALGDSYTVGTSELKINSWPEQLVRALLKKKIAIKSPVIIAGAGWTTEKLISEIIKESPKPGYDLVSLLIGVNNQYRELDMIIFKNDFPRLLDKAIELANNKPSKVFVLSIPDWGATPYAKSRDRNKISSELSQYNSVIKKLAANRNVLFIDITKISRNAIFDLGLIASDSLHPSKRMYAAWVAKIKKKLLKKL